MKDNVLIIAGGNFPEFRIDEYLSKDPFIIAVDRGYEFLYENEIEPDLLIGDLDSVDKKVLNIRKEKIIEYPVRKDLTDMGIAFEKAIEYGAKNVVVFGGTGTRIDHTIINIFMLKKLFDEGINCKIIDNNNEITVIKGQIELKKSIYKYFSIIPISKNVSINIDGSEYNLNNKEVRFADCLTISNEIKSDKAVINVSDYCIITQSND